MFESQHLDDALASEGTCPPPYRVWSRGYDGEFTWTLEPENMAFPAPIAAHIVAVNVEILRFMYTRRELDVN